MLTIHYDEQIRARINRDNEQLTLPEDVETIAELRSWLGQRNTTWQYLFNSPMLRATRDQDILDDSSPLKHNDDITFITLVAGG